MANDPTKQSVHDNLSNIKYDDNIGDMPMPEPSVFVVKITLEKPDNTCHQRIDTLSFELKINATFFDEAMRKARELVSEFIPNRAFSSQIILKNGEEVK